MTSPARCRRVDHVRQLEKRLTSWAQLATPEPASYRLKQARAELVIAREDWPNALNRSSSAAALMSIIGSPTARAIDQAPSSARPGARGLAAAESFRGNRLSNSLLPVH